MSLFTTLVHLPANCHLAAIAAGGNAIQLTEDEVRALMGASERWTSANPELARALGIELPAALPAIVEHEPEAEPVEEVEELKPQPKVKKPSSPTLRVATNGRQTLVHYDLGRAR